METMRRVALLACFVFSAPCSLSQAAPTAPDALLSSATSELTAAIRESKGQTDGPAKLIELVETKILPLFDFSRMTQLAAARNWRLASAAQQDALTAEFRTLLVRTYSAALASYRDQTITYKPLRALPGDTDVTVRSEVRQKGAPLKIDYDMVKTPDGWKVYDVKIDGVSLVTAYREGFAAKVRDAGVDGLIQALAEKNRQNASAQKPATALAGG